MATILVFQHSASTGPGRLGVTLRDHGFRLDIRRVDIRPEQGGHPVPQDLDGYQGVICLGGPQDPDEHHPWMLDELLRIHEAHKKGIPLLGVCLGCQMMARALGGEIDELDKPEIGFQPVTLNMTGQIEAILAGIPWTTRMFCHHGYGVTALPEGAVSLADSPRVKNQIIRFGPTSYGFQPHIEADRGLVDSIFALAPDLNSAAGVTADALGAEASQYYARSAEVMDRLAVNLAALLFPTRDLITV